MANRVRCTTLKFVSACGLALTVASLGVGAGAALADGHNIVDGDGTWGAPDGAQERGTSIVPALHAIDASEDVPAVYPAAPSWPAPPSWGSYPAPPTNIPDPSWPGEGWGVADN